MFKMIVAFIVSLIIEVILVLFTSPESSSERVNHLPVFLLVINTTILVSILGNFIFIGIYFLFQWYEELQHKSYIRRGVLVGCFLGMLLLTRLYNVLDYIVLIFLIIAILLIELISLQKK